MKTQHIKICGVELKQGLEGMYSSKYLIRIEDL